MIEIKAKTHTLRMFAQDLPFSDVFKIILYTSYAGDKTKIPFYYSIVKGMSASTDLTLPMDELLKKMKSNTRNEISRAEREGCTFEVVSDFEEFIPFYNDFCSSKGLDDYTSKGRMAKYEKVLITKAVHNGDILAMHANVLDEKSKIAFLLYSCSKRLDAGVDRKMIGWGNRFLHYKELEYIKQLGYMAYDWSGVCVDENNPQHTIGQFKLSFGGELVESWSLKTPLFALLEGVRNFVIRFRK